MTRALDIRIVAARDTGFAVYDTDILIGAFATPAEAALWLENRMLQVDGEKRIEPREEYPNVISAVETARKRGLLDRIKNG